MEINNQKFYAKIFTSFLNCTSICKILIADSFTFIVYTLLNTVPDVIKRSSIFINRTSFLFIIQ